MKFSTAALTTLAATAVLAAPSANDNFSVTYKGYDIGCNGGTCKVACSSGSDCGIAGSKTVNINADVGTDLQKVLQDVQTLLQDVVTTVKDLLSPSS